MELYGVDIIYNDGDLAIFRRSTGSRWSDYCSVKPEGWQRISSYLPKNEFLGTIRRFNIRASEQLASLPDSRSTSWSVIARKRRGLENTVKFTEAVISRLG